MKKNNHLKSFFSNSEIKAAPFVIGTCLALDAFAPGLGTLMGISVANSEKIADALKQPIGSIFSKISGDSDSRAKAEKNHTNSILFANASEKCLESAKQKFFDDSGLTTVNDDLKKVFKDKKESFEKLVFEPFFKKLNEPEFVAKVFETNQQLTPGDFLQVVFDKAIDFEANELKALKEHRTQILETITQTFKDGFTEQFKVELAADEQLKASYHTHLLHNLVGDVMEIKDDVKEVKDGVKDIKEGVDQLLEGKAKKISKHLTKSPLYPTDFLGRGKDLGDLRKKLVEGDNLLLLVNGQGGMGKTTLASRYYHDFEQEYKHLAWVLNEGGIKNALLTMRLGVGFTEAELKMQDDEQFLLLQTKLVNLEKPCLLVIDNVNNPEVLQRGIMSLQGLSGFHILMTSRITEFSGVETLKVDGLKEVDAIELFKKHYPDHNPQEDELLQQIIANVDRNTLVIEILAKNLEEVNALEKNYSLEEMAQDLQRGLTHLKKSEQIATVYQAKKDVLRTEKPEDIIMAMYEARKLSEGEKRLTSIFALLPNEPIAYTFLKDYCSYDTLQTDLKSLAKKGWLDFDKHQKQFKANQVVQDVVLIKQKDRLFDDAQELVQKLSDHIGVEENLAIEKFALTEQMVRYTAIILEKFSALEPKLAWLCFDLGNFYTRTGNLGEAMRFFAEQHAIFETLLKANLKDENFKNGLAISYSKLGETHTALGNLERALEFFQDGTNLFVELYEAYPNNVSFKNGLAISYSKLGETHTALGNLERALEFFQERSRLGEELYEAYPNNVSFKNGLAISYSKLGSTHTALGNLERALEFFQERSRLGEELYEAYPNNVSFKNGLAISYEKLGSTHTALGNLERALEFFELDAKITKELYEAYPNNVSFKNGLGISYEKLGSTHTTLGNLERALEFFELDAKITKELYEAYPNNVSFKNGLAISYEKLGSTHTALGNLERALEFFQERSRLGEELYEAYPNNVSFKNGLAISYEKLGSTHTALGNLERALEFFELDAKITKELYEAYPNNVSFKNGLGISYEKLGSTHTTLGNLERALEFFELDAKITKELYEAYPNNVSFKNGLAISYSKLGTFYRDHKNNDTMARTYLEKAKAFWVELSVAFPAYVEFKNNLAWVNRQLENQ